MALLMAATKDLILLTASLRSELKVNRAIDSSSITT